MHTENTLGCSQWFSAPGSLQKYVPNAVKQRLIDSVFLLQLLVELMGCIESQHSDRSNIHKCDQGGSLRTHQVPAWSVLPRAF